MAWTVDRNMLIGRTLYAIISGSKICHYFSVKEEGVGELGSGCQFEAAFSTALHGCLTPESVKKI